MRDQFSGRAQLKSLDNDRCPGLEWTTVEKMLTGRAAAGKLMAD